jgi:hypothetical protein
MAERQLSVAHFDQRTVEAIVLDEPADLPREPALPDRKLVGTELENSVAGDRADAELMIASRTLRPGKVDRAAGVGDELRTATVRILRKLGGSTGYSFYHCIGSRAVAEKIDASYLHGVLVGNVCASGRAAIIEIDSTKVLRS